MNEDLKDRWADFTNMLDKAADEVPRFMQLELSKMSKKMRGELPRPTITWALLMAL